MLVSPYTLDAVPEVGLHVAFISAIQMHDGDSVALVNAITEKQYTYDEVVENIRRTAAGLWRLGVRKGDMVAMFSPNTPEYVFMFFGVMCTGATLTTINPSYTVYEVSHHLKDSGATYLYTIADSYEVAQGAVKEGGVKLKKIICVGDVPGTMSFYEVMSAPASEFPEDVPISPKEDVVVVPYSSGTTGLPKGVMLTHHNVISNMMQMSHPGFRGEPEQQLGPQVIMAFMPFFHAYGMIAIMIGGLIGGSKLILLPRFVPEQFLCTIEKYKVQMLPVVPPVIVFMANSPLVSKYDLSSVTTIFSAAAPLSKDTEDEFKKKLNYKRDLKQAYGMTETTVCATVYPFEAPIRPGSSGVPVPGTEIQMVDPSSGAVMGEGERGEVWVRGPQIMKGYLNKPEATQTTKDSQGWLHTGDIAYYDKDGYIYIVDRLKELIKYKGFQVAPAELEALLLNHPLVADAGVIGVPDKEAGELPRAYVVKHPNVQLTVDDVYKYVAERTAKFKHLSGGVEFLTAIPKSLSGKILRRQLRDMAQKDRTSSKI